MDSSINPNSTTGRGWPILGVPPPQFDALQFCGQSTASASNNNGMAFVHQLVSFDDEMNVLANSMLHSIAECDYDNAVQNAWSLLDNSDKEISKGIPDDARMTCH